MAKNLKEIKVRIRCYHLALDPPIEVFNVEVSDEQGLWKESLGSKELLEAFVKGIKAGASLGGCRVEMEEIVRKRI